MLSLTGVRDSATEPCPAAGGEVSHPFFRRTAREVLSAQACFGAKVTMPRPKSAAARAGIKFEAQVCEQLAKRYGSRFAAAIPFTFCESSPARGFSRPSTAIPDGLLLGPDGRSLCVVEIKLRHGGDAWHQLNRFYLPILRKCLRGAFHLRVLEICANYDPGVKLPNGTDVLNDVDEVWAAKRHPVLLWSRR
jgi:hypothetical protein